MFDATSQLKRLLTEPPGVNVGMGITVFASHCERWRRARC